jgi:probable rRNA maturation factor
VRIRKGKLIPRDDGKRIEELVGAAHTGTDSVSIAKMLAPPGWAEPAQTPEFDEAVMVLKGTLTLVLGNKRERIAAGEVGWVPKRTRVVYRNDERVACEYFSVCVPAFRPHRAHMEPKPGPPENRVAVECEHAAAKKWRGPLSRQALAFMSKLELAGSELTLSLVGDAAIRKLNRQWRGKDEATDVLSFPAGDLPAGTPGPKLLGDVVISLDTAARQAKAYRRPLSEELDRYLAHGLLHLLGHDHLRAADAKKMQRWEERLLGAQGMISL